MQKVKIHELQGPNGLVYVMQEGNQFTPVERITDQSQLSGLFSKGGFFDKVINTASGAFKKEDGSPTFIGESIQHVASSFGDSLANRIAVGNNNMPYGGGLPGFNPLLQQGSQQSNLPLSHGNPLPPSNDKTMLYVLGAIAAIGAGAGIYYATKKK